MKLLNSLANWVCIIGAAICAYYLTASVESGFLRSFGEKVFVFSLLWVVVSGCLILLAGAVTSLKLFRQRWEFSDPAIRKRKRDDERDDDHGQCGLCNKRRAMKTIEVFSVLKTYEHDRSHSSGSTYYVDERTDYNMSTLRHHQFGVCRRCALKPQYSWLMYLVFLIAVAGCSAMLVVLIGLTIMVASDMGGDPLPFWGEQRSVVSYLQLVSAIVVALMTFVFLWLFRTGWGDDDWIAKAYVARSRVSGAWHIGTESGFDRWKSNLRSAEPPGPNLW